MNETYKENWKETKEVFEAWWNHKSIGRPMMRIVGKREKPLEPLEQEIPYETHEDKYMNVPERIKRYRNYCRTHLFFKESFPNIDLNIGPGSLAVYLGSMPVFAESTVWYQEVIHDWKEFGPFRYDPENIWWKRHLAMIRQAVCMAQDDFLVNIPDLIENVDILSAMRGPQTFCYDLMDEPELMEDYVRQLDDLYFRYYDEMYNAVKGPDGSSSYTAFHLWGPGKTAKVQCDFCAMMSPSQFRRFVQPSLAKQCQALDHSMYHLDGPDAVRHLDALMEIPELDALQWTPGAGQPDGADSKWYPIYDKVRKAGKSLWIWISDGGLKERSEGADRLIKRYGSDGLYLLFHDMDESDAYKLLEKADRDWNNS